jgi:glutamate transport system permease protein
MSSQSVLFDAPGPKARRNILIANILGTLLIVGGIAWIVSRLNDAGQFEARLWKPLIEQSAWVNFLLPGLRNTLIAAALSIVLATTIGTLFGVGRLSSHAPVRWVCGVIVEFFRAVPVLIMMVAGWVLFSRMAFIPREHAPLIAVVVALTLYNGAVIAELVRSGVHGLPKGQREAGLAIGMTRSQSLRNIELPQALLAMLPSLVSQFVVVLKDSALGQIITYQELLRQARLLGSRSPMPVLQALLVAAVIFILINYLLSLGTHHRQDSPTCGT